jgi:hypothetical protein
MTKYEELCEQAYAEQVEIKHVDVPVPGMSAVYIRAKGKRCIFIKRQVSTEERSCFLAEELGHHFTGSDRVLRYDCPEDWKDEARARRWAHARLITPDAIRTAARNTDDIYEIADVLSVTVDFLTEAISDYVTKGLWPSCPLAL